MRQGPHQGAHQSMRTIPSFSATSLKLSFVTATMAMAFPSGAARSTAAPWFSHV